MGYPPYPDLRFRYAIFFIVTFLALGNQITSSSLLVIGTYLVLGFVYLVLVPLFLYFWMNNRWHFMGKLERLGIYGLVFLFFPGLILFAPFLNLRMKAQGEE